MRSDADLESKPQIAAISERTVPNRPPRRWFEPRPRARARGETFPEPTTAVHQERPQPDESEIAPPELDEVGRRLDVSA
jgi:hypothetical protein